ncbi:MAG: ferritin [Chloroflexi bacterium]|nr:ferritin [Chloroflexota bacterium]
MKLSGTMQAAFNEQIRLEYESMYAYQQMSAFCHEQNLQGFGLWMRAQAAEELTHALKFTDFVLDRGSSVQLKDVPASSATFTTPLSVFEAALGHEQRVSAAIEALYRQAVQESDFASQPLLQWFINEQIEEESSVGLIVERIRMAGDNGAALLMLDRELGARGSGGAGASSGA